MLLQKLCFLRRKLHFYLIFTVLKCNYTPFISYAGENIKSCWSWVCYNQFQYCFDTISIFTSNKNNLVQIMNEICPVYKGMLKPIIISYKLTTCHLLYLTNSYKPKEILLTIIWQSRFGAQTKQVPRLRIFLTFFTSHSLWNWQNQLHTYFLRHFFIFEVESVLVFNST